MPELCSRQSFMEWLSLEGIGDKKMPELCEKLHQYE
jgi:hypothetical protein